jgi:hypothetical protein
MNHDLRKTWTDYEDELLLDLISEDMPFREIANHLGRTRNACIGRMSRLSKALDNGKQKS